MFPSLKPSISNIVIHLRYIYKTIIIVKQKCLKVVYFSTRNFDLSIQRVDPSISWTFRPGLVMSVNGTVTRKSDAISGLNSVLVQIPVQARAQIQRRLDILARFEFANADVSGEADGMLGYELTNGRGPGPSTLWRLSVQSNLTEVLTATASYDGRNPSTGDIIHTGRFQLSARF